MELAGVDRYTVPAPTGSHANMVLFEAKLEQLLRPQTTTLVMRLDIKEIEALSQEPANTEAALALLNQPGFPKFQGSRNTAEALWFVLTNAEQTGLMVAAKAIAHNDQLDQLFRLGLLEWKTTTRILDCVEVTLSWSADANAKLVNID